MEVTPLAAESLGVRGLAVEVSVSGTTILVDPGASLGPRRFGRLPHREEYRALKARSEAIQRAGSSADAIVVTHYHFDHYVPSFENWRYNWSADSLARDLFSSVHVLAKHTTEDINYSQQKRAYYFEEVCRSESKRLELADGEAYSIGPASLEFSPPVPHGPEDTDLGRVLMVAIHGPADTFVYTSDVQGPVVDESRDWILDRNPDLIVADGPPTYLSEDTFSTPSRRSARRNLVSLAREASLVVDHHLLRETTYEEFLRPVREAASDAGTSVQTAAAYRGEANRLLEANREVLHDRAPVSEEFYDRVEAGDFVDTPIPNAPHPGD
ncbi:MAG: MBL fold metallo-hydrolase [Halodesulfurarchaeum sp.]